MTIPPEYKHPWDIDRVFQGSPFLQDLGVRGVSLDSNGAEFELQPAARHRNAAQVVHGGVIASLLDIACGFPVMVLGNDVDLVPSVTLSLSVNYVGGARGKVIRAKGRVVGGGRSVVFCRGEVIDQDGTTVAIADGSFKRLLPRKPTDIQQERT